MKNMKKVLGVLLAVVFAFSMMPMSALAVETAAAEINGTPYNTLAEAVAAAKDGEVVKVLKTQTIEPFRIDGKKITLDLNGYTVSGLTKADSKTDIVSEKYDYFIGVAADAGLTINDSSAAKTGQISAEASMNEDSVVIAVRGALTLNNGEITGLQDKLRSGSDYGFLIRADGADIQINGGKLTAKGGIPTSKYDVSKDYLLKSNGDSTIVIKDGVFTNATRGDIVDFSNDIVTISGGVFEHSGNGYVLDTYSKTTMNVTGGTFVQTGTEDLMYASGTTTFTGGSFKKTGKGNLAYISGKTVVFDGGNFECNSDGTLFNTGYKAHYTVKSGRFTELAGKGIHDKGAVVIGGKYNQPIDPQYCAPDYIPAGPDANGDYYVKSAPLAMIGSAEYDTLEAAILAAKKGDTIVLKRDAELVPQSGTSNQLTTHLVIDKDLTLDLSGKTVRWAAISQEAFDALKGQPLMFRITNGANVTVTGNGAVDASFNGAGAYGFNLDDGNLTIENGTYTGSATAVQVEKGVLNIQDGTFQVAAGMPAQYAKYLINCIDSAFENGNAKIVVSGGTFIGFDPAGDPEGPGTSYVADGYKTSKVEGNFEVVVDPAKAAAHINGTVYATLADAVAAAKAGDTVTLMRHIVMPYPTTPGEGLRPDFNITKDLTLNMNGFTIKRNACTESVNGVPAFFAITSGVKVTVTGSGKMDAELGDNSSYCINVNHPDAVLTIENGIFLGAPTAIQVQAGSLQVKGGTFDMAKTCKAAAPAMSKYIVNCIDKSFQDGLAKIVISGGNFVGFNPADNPEGNGTTYLADGYKTVMKGDQWSVDVDEAKAEAQIGTTLYATLEEAVAAAQTGDTVKILRNVVIDPTNGTSGTLNPMMYLPYSITLDFNGKTVSWNQEMAAKSLSGVPVFFSVYNGASITVIGGGKLDTALGDNSAYGFNVYDQGSTLSIFSGTFTGAPTAIQVQEGTLKVYGGNFLLADPVPAEYSKYIINCLDKSYLADTANIYVKGGTFGFDPSAAPEGKGTSYVANGFISKDNGNGTFTVEENNVKVAEVDGKQYSNLETAVEVVKNGGVVKLLNDVVMLAPVDGLDNSLNTMICVDKSFTLDMNGKKISWDYEPGTVCTGIPNFFSLIGNAHLTITGNGIMDTELGNNGSYAVNIYSKTASVTVESGTFYGGPTVFQVENGSLTVKGGTFKLTDSCRKSNPEYAKYLINCIDRHFASGDAKISVTGGTFEFDPSANPEGNNTTYLATGYVSEMANGMWTVKRNPALSEAQIGNVKYPTLVDAIAAAKAGDTVTLLLDVLYKDPIVINKEMTLNLNGKTITFDGDAGDKKLENGYLNPVDGAKLTINGNGTITYHNSDNYTLGMAIVASGNAVVNIENGTFHAGLTVVQIQDTVVCNIKGGLFKADFDFNNRMWILNKIDSSKETASFRVTGGTFENYDPSNSDTESPADNFVVPGYEAVKDGNDFVVDTVKVAAINGQKFETLQAAINAAKAGETVVLLKDIELNEYLFVENDAIIDLAGHTLNAHQFGVAVRSNVSAELKNGNILGYIQNQGKTKLTNIKQTNKEGFNCVFNVTGAELIIDKDSVLQNYKNTNTILDAGGTVISEGQIYAMGTSTGIGTGQGYTGSKFVINGGLVQGGSGEESPAILMGAASSLIINGGEIKGFGYGISGNGTQHNTTIEINGGTIISENGAAIYHPQDGVLTITNGTLTGKNSALEIRSGKANISGGTFTALADQFLEEKNGNGTTITGAAIAISQHTTNKNIDVNITGGTFNGVKALYEKDLMDTQSDNIKLAVSGGSFNGSVASQNVQKFVSGGLFTEKVSNEQSAVGFVPTDANADGKFTVQTDNAVAIIVETGAKFETVSAALAAAEAGQTVQLIKDSAEGNLMITKGITLDLNGHTLTADYLVAFNGNHVIDSANSAGKGLLIISEANVSFSGKNRQLPVWNGTNGYIFATMKMQQKHPVATEAGDGFTFLFRPVFESGNMSEQLFQNGAVDNHVQFILRLSWTTSTGAPVTQDFVYSEELVKKTYTPSTDGLVNVFKIVTHGFTNDGSYQNIRVCSVVKTAQQEHAGEWLAFSFGK